jgi:hypothetical protein
VVIATGVTYRRLGIPGLDPLRGHWGLLWGRRRRSARTRWPRGIRHRRSELRRPGCIAPSEVASRVTLLIRGLSLAAGMSDYLVRQLQETPNLDVQLGTRMTDGRGKTHLEALTLEELGTGHEEEVPASAVFVLIGAEPHTDWLRDVIELDERGYVLTRPRHSAVGKAWASGTAALRDKCAWRVRRRGRPVRVGQRCRRCRWRRVGHRGLGPPVSGRGSRDSLGVLTTHRDAWRV